MMMMMMMKNKMELMMVMIFIGLFGVVNGLYEDHAGVYDWSKENIGMVKLMAASQNVLVAWTDRRVLAGINTKDNGSIAWRYVFTNKEISSLTVSSSRALTVSNCILSVWIAESGGLLGDTRVCKTSSSFIYAGVVPGVVNNLKRNILIVRKDGFRVWHQSAENTYWEHDLSNIVGATCTKDGCFVYVKSADEPTYTVYAIDAAQKSVDLVAAASFVIPTPGAVYAVNVDEDEKRTFMNAHTKKIVNVDATGEMKYEPTTGILRIGKDSFAVERDAIRKIITSSTPTAWSTAVSPSGSAFSSVALTDTGLVWYSSELDSPVTLKLVDQQMRQGDRGIVLRMAIQSADKVGNALRLRVYLQMEDGSLLGFEYTLDLAKGHHSEEMMLTREEGLAYISQFGAIEIPFEEQETSARADEFAELFARKNAVALLLFRFADQVRSIKDFFVNTVRTVVDIGVSLVESKGMLLVQAYKGQLTEGYSDAQLESFGFRQGLILCSRIGKIFAVDSLTGDILWSVFDTRFKGEDVKLIVTRMHDAGAHHPAEILLLDESTGVALWRNALTGAVLREQHVNAEILTTIVIPTNALQAHKDASSSDILPAAVVVAVDSSHQVHVLPEAKKAQVLGKKELTQLMYFVDHDEKSVRGFHISAKGTVDTLWQYPLPGRLLSINRYTGGRVNNPGIPLPDGSVMVKHINQHLIFVATTDAAGDLVVSIIDGVSGRLTRIFKHKGASGPVHSVLYDNIVLYTYWNMIAKRQEISSVGLYDGVIDRKSLNLWTTRNPNDIGQGQEISAFDLTNTLHSVEQRTFYSDKAIRSLAVTSSRFGITDRSVLMAFENGNINLQPRQLIDPRRPKPEDKSPRAPGVVDYFPQLPILPIQTVSYYRSIAKVDAIYTVPTKLESTCLVIATGLDLFYTRVMPSKGFDLLNEDFNFGLLAALIGGLSVLSVVLRNMVRQKNMQSAWS